MIDKSQLSDMFCAFWNYASTACIICFNSASQVVVIQYYYTFCTFCHIPEQNIIQKQY